ncbi:efflux RND transporter periplasmic adaptor subunit [Pseudanabaena sp. BC1403]|uniref:efflux RND transporter periplasmic adaptor subunit n=1 Tax=Pseudanabaena sp. BC1403 TaxID=2043171 RepID=UPI000CD8F411|nr:efflux RND transporter periplasmic adaptor subunit [Pseudanabaena sp. BC1403]
MAIPRPLSRLLLVLLVIIPLGIIGVLAVTILLPTLKNPESRSYSSDIGYPARQRKAGKPIKVETALVSQQPIDDSVSAPGESVALQEVDLQPLVSGSVAKVYVQEGDRVTKGQPLIELNKELFENMVDTARNNIAISEVGLQSIEQTAQEQIASLEANVQSLRGRVAIFDTKLSQSETLVKEGALSRFQLADTEDLYLIRKRDLYTAERELDRTRNDLARQAESLQLKLKNDQLALQNALTNLERTVIYAPNNGLVSQINIHSGEVANLNTKLMTLNQDIVFKAYVDQARLNTVKVGDRATVRFVAYPGQTYTGQVIRLNPTVETNPTQGKAGVNRQFTYSVWIRVQDLEMSPGLQGYVQFDQGRNSMVIPESSITHLSEGEGMVIVAEGGLAVVKKVKLGRTFDSQREVLDGLALGDRVVLSPRALNPGDKLET